MIPIWDFQPSIPNTSKANGKQNQIRPQLSKYIPLIFLVVYLNPYPNWNTNREHRLPQLEMPTAEIDANSHVMFPLALCSIYGPRQIHVWLALQDTFALYRIAMRQRCKIDPASVTHYIAEIYFHIEEAVFLLGYDNFWRSLPSVWTEANEYSTHSIALLLQGVVKRLVTLKQLRVPMFRLIGTEEGSSKLFSPKAIRP